MLTVSGRSKHTCGKAHRSINANPIDQRLVLGRHIGKLLQGVLDQIMARELDFLRPIPLRPHFDPILLIEMISAMNPESCAPRRLDTHPSHTQSFLDSK